MKRRVSLDPLDPSDECWKDCPSDDDCESTKNEAPVSPLKDLGKAYPFKKVKRVKLIILLVILTLIIMVALFDYTNNWSYTFVLHDWISNVAPLTTTLQDESRLAFGIPDTRNITIASMVKAFYSKVRKEGASTNHEF